MFTVNGTTIELHRGDTGTVGITFTGYDFGESDRALVSIARGGEILRQEIHEMESNRIELVFTNSDTDSLEYGDYDWDIRLAVNPIYGTDGAIIDGDGVGTPNDPMQIKLKVTIGQI